MVRYNIFDTVRLQAAAGAFVVGMVVVLFFTLIVNGGDIQSSLVNALLIAIGLAVAYALADLVRQDIE